jgi:hypothetical protein
MVNFACAPRIQGWRHPGTWSIAPIDYDLLTRPSGMTLPEITGSA